MWLMVEFFWGSPWRLQVARNFCLAPDSWVLYLLSVVDLTARVIYSSWGGFGPRMHKTRFEFVVARSFSNNRNRRLPRFTLEWNKIWRQNYLRFCFLFCTLSRFCYYVYFLWFVLKGLYCERGNIVEKKSYPMRKCCRKTYYTVQCLKINPLRKKDDERDPFFFLNVV